VASTNLKGDLYRILEHDKMYLLPQVVRRFEDAGLTPADVEECISMEWLVILDSNKQVDFYSIDEHK